VATGRQPLTRRQPRGLAFAPAACTNQDPAGEVVLAAGATARTR
jgi:hypothetical protein